MPFNYDNEDLDLHSEGFKDSLNLAPQNQLNLLLPAVSYDASPEDGDYFNDDFLKPSNPSRKKAFNAPTPDKDVALVRRVGMFDAFEDSAWINNMSQLHGLADPTSGIMMSLEAGKQRYHQAEILRALDGDGYQYHVDKSGELISRAPVAVAFPSATNDILVDFAKKHEAETIQANGNQNITLGKLNRARTLLAKATLVGEGKRYFIIDEDGMECLLNKIPVTSKDYVAAEAVAATKSGPLRGFEFIVLPNNMESGTVNIRKYFAVDSRAVTFKTRPIVTARVKPRFDRSDALQAYYAAEHGAARMVDEGVYRVFCDITK
ncbi:phage capsid protein [Asticcacaulis taihuensis]|uniref:phage capsid protein n=1 Tax=Asticcacaulis taihuensis TaxID=260084 RepID=UPI0026F3719A|nr:phage capsid protein [Asticcacaulis taihuensis]